MISDRNDVQRRTHRRSPQHVAELRKDAAVGVAYNFITDRLERRNP